MNYEEEGRKKLAEYVKEKAEQRGLLITVVPGFSDYMLGVVAEDGVEYLDYHIRGIPIIPIGDDMFEVLDNPFIESGMINEISSLTQHIWSHDEEESLNRLGITEKDLSYEGEQTINGEQKTMMFINEEAVKKLDATMDEILEERYQHWTQFKKENENMQNENKDDWKEQLENNLARQLMFRGARFATKGLAHGGIIVRPMFEELVEQAAKLDVLETVTKDVDGRTVAVMKDGSKLRKKENAKTYSGRTNAEVVQDGEE